MFDDAAMPAGTAPAQIILQGIENTGDYRPGVRYLASVALGGLLGEAPAIRPPAGAGFLSRLPAPVRRASEALWGRRLAIGLAAGGLVSAGALLLFVFTVFVPQALHYAFADSKNCVASPTFFPGLIRERPAEVFKLTHQPTISIAGKPVFSYSLCAAPGGNPLASATYIDHQQTAFAGLHITKSIKVTTSSYPAVHTGNFAVKNVPIGTSFKFTTSPVDATFDYALVVNGQTSMCSHRQASLSCSLAPLKLAYSSQYTAKLVRVFHNRVASSVTAQAFQTISATTITQSTIAAGTVVYNTPQQVVLQTDKPLTALEHPVLTAKNPAGAATNIPVTYSFSGHTITVNITNPLPRKSQFDLHIDNVTATDTSRLAQPYDLAFTTSGGPKVSGVNLASNDIVAGKAIVISFDQKLLATQDPGQLASLSANGVKQAASYSLVNNQIIITPQGSFPLCAHIKIDVTGGAQNEYGISGDSAWSFGSRARCYTTYSIGNSVRGRPISAYQFGDGSNMVLYIGATHGNEQNSMVILQKWIGELIANPDKIPAGRTVTVIPAINPDGVAANTRVNADGIDLNRNFPANNWQTNVTEPGGGGAITADGGPQALSEPESRALADFVIAKRPRLVLTYHSHAGVVEANEAADSVPLAALYASRAGYTATPTSEIGTTFDYSTTGAFEDWMHDKLGLPVFVIELQSPTADEFTRNRTAMWAMAATP